MRPIARRRRAINPQDKLERRAAIVSAAEALLRRNPAGSFRVEELARRARLGKGTVYLYFDSREEILLAVHGERTQRLFDTLEQALAARRVDARTMARATVRFLREVPEFLPLAATCRGMLEANIGAEAALAFKLSLSVRLAHIGARIEVLYPGSGRGQGVALLMNSYALMLGLWQLSDPPACLRPAMKLPQMRMFRINFEKQLTAALVDLWDAVESRGRGGAR